MKRCQTSLLEREKQLKITHLLGWQNFKSWTSHMREIQAEVQHGMTTYTESKLS